MNFYESIKHNLRENEENDSWENALNSGKVVNVYDKSGQYTPTKFFFYNGKVYYKNKAISGGSWFEHPQRNQQQIIKHIKGLLNDKEVDYAIEVLDEKPDTLYNNDKEQTSIKLNDEPKGKHYPEGKILREPDMERAGTNVRDWYMEKFPKDDLGPEIKENITFEDVFDALDRHQDFYDLIGVGDSIVRERIFEELADIMGTDYDYVYNQWLGESESLEDTYSFDEIETMMSTADSYEDLYLAASHIKDNNIRIDVEQCIEQCELDGDDVDVAYSVATSEYLDPYRNEENTETTLADYKANM